MLHKIRIFRAFQRRYSSSVSVDEITKFSGMAPDWWNTKGSMAPLHQMNPVRVAYLRQNVCKEFNVNSLSPRPFTGMRFLDVGCGAGILSESLSRLGANTLGLDASSANIQVAQTHKGTDPSLRTLEYHCTTAEGLVQTNVEPFDVVCALEVIEHVSDPSSFLNSCVSLLKPGGALVLSTINRTYKSYLLTKVAAEYVLGLCPKGTHDWKKYVTPGEIQQILGPQKVLIKGYTGFSYNPFLGRWHLTSDLSVNYGLFAVNKS